MRHDAVTESFVEVTILGRPALFTPGRIDRSTVPQGYHLYEIRHDDDCQGDAVHVARTIAVNHWGSIITSEEIPFPSNGYLDIEPEDLKYGAGGCRTMDDFIAMYPAANK